MQGVGSRLSEHRRGFFSSLINMCGLNIANITASQPEITAHKENYISALEAEVKHLRQAVAHQNQNRNQGSVQDREDTTSTYPKNTAPTGNQLTLNNSHNNNSHGSVQVIPNRPLHPRSRTIHAKRIQFFAIISRLWAVVILLPTLLLVVGITVMTLDKINCYCAGAVGSDKYGLKAFEFVSRYGLFTLFHLISSFGYVLLLLYNCSLSLFECNRLEQPCLAHTKPPSQHNHNHNHTTTSNTNDDYIAPGHALTFQYAALAYVPTQPYQTQGPTQPQTHKQT